ncbi:MAG: hydrogenase nickel incorporation protein HypB [Bryobacterales bacterium]|nr:hydrogenase nickel incorporation protein HypB [Bryobacterales bacterium]
MAKVFTLEQRILKRNSEVAEENRRGFDAQGVFVVSLASSPGSGKTSLLEKSLALLREELSVGVVEGDVQTDRDARRIEALGVPVVQVVTNGTCHLDAQMVQGALAHLETGRMELLFIENVGNLVCPAAYDLGEHLRIVLSSTTEGEDKPLKYPAMFRRSQAMVLNKIDLLPYVPFDLAEARTMALRVNPSLEIFETSCTTGAGIPEFCQWIVQKLSETSAA